MKFIETNKYFHLRAPRYQNALHELPLARTLDLLPYCYAFNLRGLTKNTNILDAFGGTGFLSKSFCNIKGKFVISDSSETMLQYNANRLNTETFCTRNDFKDLLEKYGKNSFDYIFSHGGFHHVVSKKNSRLDKSISYQRQQNIVGTLSELLKKGAILVIADIPNTSPVEEIGVFTNTKMQVREFKKYLGDASYSFMLKALSMNQNTFLDIRCFQNIIKKSGLQKKVNFPVPRNYFDKYISRYTKLGHVACYPEFNSLEDTANQLGLMSIGRINYNAPWLFSSPLEAGWFFKEKFAIYNQTNLHSSKQVENKVYKLIENYLGAGRNDSFTGINWGVTYGAFIKQ